MIARLSCEHIELNSEIVYIWGLECNLEKVYTYLLIETLNKRLNAYLNENMNCCTYV